jgi:pSer/pThr/pTyr-binding forkhead associated (FHA) protein
MDGSGTPPEADGLPVPGADRPAPAEPELPAGFVPLRLILQPSRTAIELDRPDMLVGRHSACDVRLPLPDVSRRHCRFIHVEGCWQVVDLNSLNGVFVNEEAVLQSPLRQGDLVRIGGFTFAVDLSPCAAADPESLIQGLFDTLQHPPRPEPHRQAG